MLTAAESRPLLCRSPLFPDESLPSYLNRLAAMNCYEPASLLTTVGNKRLAQLGLRDNLYRPRHPETFDILASMTGLSPRELANSSIHRFAQAPVLSKMEKQVIHLSDGRPLHLLDGFLRLRKLHRNEWIQFCPDCLRKAAYHRLSWTLRDVTACLKHRCLLIEHCPSCHVKVTLRDIVQRSCAKCSSDLAAAAPNGIQDEPLGLFAQRTIQAWWGMDVPPEEHPVWTLPEQPASALYQLFQSLLDSCQTEWENEHSRRLTERPSDLHVIQMMAFRVLVNWPRGFCEFLRGWLEHEVFRRSYRYYCNFYGSEFCLRGGSLFAHWVSSSPESLGFSFIQEVVDQFLMENNIRLDFDCQGRCRRIRIRLDEDLQRISQSASRKKWERYQELAE